SAIVVGASVCPCFARSISSLTRSDRRRPVSTTAWPSTSSHSRNRLTSVVRPEPSAPSTTMSLPTSVSSGIRGSRVPYVLSVMGQSHPRWELREHRLEVGPQLGLDRFDRARRVDDSEIVELRESVVLVLQPTLEPGIALDEVVR